MSTKFVLGFLPSVSRAGTNFWDKYAVFITSFCALYPILSSVVDLFTSYEVMFDFLTFVVPAFVLCTGAYSYTAKIDLNSKLGQYYEFCVKYGLIIYFIWICAMCFIVGVAWASEVGSVVASVTMSLLIGAPIYGWSSIIWIVMRKRLIATVDAVRALN